jgi:uncharacterized glyoxalase superfamily protein PhnB
MPQRVTPYLFYRDAPAAIDFSRGHLGSSRRIATQWTTAASVMPSSAAATAR